METTKKHKFVELSRNEMNEINGGFSIPIVVTGPIITNQIIISNIIKWISK